MRVVGISSPSYYAALTLQALKPPFIVRHILQENEAA